MGKVRARQPVVGQGQGLAEARNTPPALAIRIVRGLRKCQGCGRGPVGRPRVRSGRHSQPWKTCPPGTANARLWWSVPSLRLPEDRSPAGRNDVVADLPHREPLRAGSEGVAVLLALAQPPAQARERGRSGRVLLNAAVWRAFSGLAPPSSTVRFTRRMAHLVYIDETGSVGKGAKKQQVLTLAAVLVHEDNVQALAEAFREVARKHLGLVPAGFELHGNEIWQGTGAWASLPPAACIAVYEDAVAVLDELDINVSHASIHKERLHRRYGGDADDNAYLLALQFLLEKIDGKHEGNKILIADEQKEHQLRAVKMVADLQEWGGGEVPGKRLKTVIDSMHFVSSHASPGVQLADLVAYALQRRWNNWDSHPNAQAAIARIGEKIEQHTYTWRAVWPAAC